MATLIAPPDDNCAALLSVYSVTPTAVGITTIASPPDTGAGGSGGGSSITPPTAWGCIG